MVHGASLVTALWPSPVAPQGFLIAVLRLSCPVACAILVPQPRIKSRPPALEGGSSITGPPGKPWDCYPFKKRRKKRKGKTEETSEHAASFFFSLPRQPLCKDSGKPTRRFSEKTAIYQLRRDLLQEPNPADMLILDFQPPELWENSFLWFKPPILWSFVMTAQTD